MLVGRERECAQLQALVGQAGSAGGVLVVRGEPGIGKSSLLSYARSQAGDVSVLRATGVESESELTYAGLHALLHPVLGRLGELPQLHAEALASAFGLRRGRAEDRFLVSLGALGLLSAAASDDGLVCIIDDAQWLDRASADAIVFAARRLEADGVVVLLGARDNVGEPIAVDLPELRLEGLEPDAAASLVAASVSARVRDQLVAATRGNPLALLEVPRVLSPGQREGSEPLPDPLPVGEQVARAFLSAMGHFSPAARGMALLVATDDTQDRGTICRAAAAMGVNPAALAELEASGLVDAPGLGLALRHPLARSAIYSAAGAGARQQAHRALAAVLTGERRTWHLAAAADTYDAGIADELDAVATGARARTAHATAAAASERAARLSADEGARARRLGAAAASSWDAGHVARVGPLLEQALPLLAAEERASLGLLRGDLALEQGRPAEAFELLVTAADALMDRDPAFGLRMLARAAEATWWLNAPQMSIRLRRIAGRVTLGGDAYADFITHLLVGCAQMLGEEFQGGVADLRTVLEIADGLDADVGMAAGFSGVWIGAPREGRAWFARFAASRRAEGNLRELPFALSQLAAMDAWLGNISDGVGHVTEALRLAHATGQARTVAHASVTLATLEAIRGREQETRTAVRNALAGAIGGSALQAARSSFALGRLELGLGRPATAMAHLATMQNSGRGVSHALISRTSTPDLVESAMRAGRPDVARSALAAFEPWEQATNSVWARSVGARMRGLVAESEANAWISFEASLDAIDEHFPLDQARTRLVYGEALRRARRRSDAQEQLRAAQAVFEVLGAAPWAERARLELRATGEAAVRGIARSRERLTPQELQIARFAAAGATNKQIAARLFLSVRTIEYHLHKVFTTLDITSRHDLAPLVLDHGTGHSQAEPASPV